MSAKIHPLFGPAPLGWQWLAKGVLIPDPAAVAKLTPEECAARDEAIDARLDKLACKLIQLRADSEAVIERRMRSEFDYLMHTACSLALLRRQGE